MPLLGMEDNKKTSAIEHPHGHITIPSTIANKYSFFSLQSNTQWKQENITLQEFNYKHIKQFFALENNQQSSWSYENPSNSTITSDDIYALQKLNDFLSAGNHAQQSLAIPFLIANTLKARPKDIYKNLPLLTLYEQIFDSVDKPMQKSLALQADNQNDHTSFCCALYMAMYNPNISDLWYQVTKKTAIGYTEKNRKYCFDLKEKVEFSDPFFLALQKWKQHDPACRLFGKLMDALGHDSTTLGLFTNSDYSHGSEVNINKTVTSLHNFDVCYWYLREDDLKQQLNPISLYACNAFDRTHLPLIVEWCRYIKESQYQKAIESGNVSRLSAIKIGDNQSIRRFYDVDSFTLHKPIFCTRTRIVCDAKPTAHFDGLNTIPPSKEITFSLHHLPPNIDATFSHDFPSGNKFMYAYKVFPAWWRIKTITYWAFIVGGFYYIRRILQLGGSRIIQNLHNDIIQHTETIKQHPTALSTLQITNPSLVSEALDTTTIIPSLSPTDQVTTTPESLILTYNSLTEITFDHNRIRFAKYFFPGSTVPTIPSAGLLGYIWNKGTDSLANLLYAIFPSRISQMFSSYMYPPDAACTINVNHKDT
jgi:hypothetical protein